MNFIKKFIKKFINKTKGQSVFKSKSLLKLDKIIYTYFLLNIFYVIIFSTNTTCMLESKNLIINKQIDGLNIVQAIRNDRIDILEKLLKSVNLYLEIKLDKYSSKTEEIGYLLMKEACTYGTIDALKLIADNFSACGYIFPIDTEFNHHTDLCKLACKNNKDPRILKFLLNNLNKFYYKNVSANPLYSLLLEACTNGLLETVKFIIEKTPEKYYFSDCYYTNSLLISACQNQNGPEILNFLFDKLNECKSNLKNEPYFNFQAKSEIGTELSFILLCKTCKYGTLETLKYLLDKPEIKTALNVCSEKKTNKLKPLYYIDKTRSCSEKKIYAFKPFCCACSNIKDPRIIKFLFEIMPEIDFNFRYNNWKILGYQMLYKACIKGNLEIVKFLIENTKAKEYIFNKSGYRHDSTVLHAALSRGNNLEIIRFLIENTDAKKYINDRIFKSSYKCIDDDKIKILIESGLKHGLKIDASIFFYYLYDNKTSYYDGNIRKQRYYYNYDYEVIKKILDNYNINLNISLKESGYSYNDKDYDDFTPLIFACESNNAKIVKLILDKGANPIFPTLHIACENQNLEMVQELLFHNISTIETKKEVSCYHKEYTNITPIDIAFELKDTKIFKAIIEKTPNLNKPINAGKYGNYTPLTLACQYGDLETVTDLISKGADINLIDENYQNCLQTACQGKNFDPKLIKFLLDNIDINYTNKDGLNPLHIACLYKNSETVEFLLENGAKNLIEKTCNLINYKNNDKEYYRNNEEYYKNLTPLQIACINNDSYTIDILLKYGANLNKVTEKGSNLYPWMASIAHPFVIACFEKKLNTIDSMLKNGLKLNETVSFNEDNTHKELTPFHFLCQNKHDQAFNRRLDIGHNNVNILEKFIEYGADLNTIFDDGQTPLIVACRSGQNTNFIKKLIMNGANIIKGQSTKNSPVRIKSKGIMKLLIEFGFTEELPENSLFIEDIYSHRRRGFENYINIREPYLKSKDKLQFLLDVIENYYEQKKQLASCERKDWTKMTKEEKNFQSDLRDNIEKIKTNLKILGEILLYRILSAKPDLYNFENSIFYNLCKKLIEYKEYIIIEDKRMYNYQFSNTLFLMLNHNINKNYPKDEYQKETKAINEQLTEQFNNNYKIENIYEILITTIKINNLFESKNFVSKLITQKNFTKKLQSNNSKNLHDCQIFTE